MNLLWLALIIPANRFVGMGLVSRLISLPLACLIIAVCLKMAMGNPQFFGLAEWFSIPILAAAFALGRGPAVSNGFKIVDRIPLDPSRDKWPTRWITWLATHISKNIIAQDVTWDMLRIGVYYAPFFWLIGCAYASIIYAACWTICYAEVRPVWRILGLKEYPNFTTNAAEWAECIGLTIIIAVILSIKYYSQ